MNADYVIGSGVAGLVFAYFNPTYKVVGLIPGGAMAEKFPLGPRYLHVSPFVEEFLRSLNLIAGKQITLSAGVFFDGRLLDPDKLSPALKSDYFLKTRGLYTLSPIEAALTPSYRAYEGPTIRQIVKQLLITLRSSGRLIPGKVTAIDPTKRIFYAKLSDTQPDEAFTFSRLAVTIPYPDFLTLLPLPRRPGGGAYLGIPVSFVFYPGDFWPFPTSDYNYVYFPDLATRYSRLSYVSNESGEQFVCAEYPGADAFIASGIAVALAYEELFPNGQVYHPLDAFHLPYGRIVSRPVPKDFFVDYGIRFFGRFAEWQDWILTHHLVERAQMRWP